MVLLHLFFIFQLVVSADSKIDKRSRTLCPLRRVAWGVKVLDSESGGSWFQTLIGARPGLGTQPHDEALGDLRVEQISICSD